MAEQAVVEKTVEKQGEISGQKEQEVQKAEVKQEVQEQAKPEVKEDLLTRVKQFKQEPVKKEADNPFGLTKEDYDAVQKDPTLQKFYKSMLSDYTRKTQNLSEKERELESKKTGHWTADRIQRELLNDPMFVQEAQKLAQAQSPQDEYSGLTEREKAEIKQAREEARYAQLKLQQFEQRQLDESLKTKYESYNPEAVDILTADLLAGKVQATREHLFKAWDYDNMQKRVAEAAYELGLKDAKEGNLEKQQSMSTDGFSATPAKDVPKIEQGESNRDYFRRIALKNLTQSSGLKK